MAPRAEARLGDQEVVITYVDRSLIVYLQRYVDGVPTTGAEIELLVDFLPSYPEEIAPASMSPPTWRWRRTARRSS